MAYKFEPWREKLRAAVVLSGLKDRPLALKAGLSEDYIRFVIGSKKSREPGGKPPEAGELIIPTIDKLHAIVNALDLTLNDLFDEEELNTREIQGRMAERGLARVFSQIADLPPREQTWMLGAIEQQLELLDRIPAKKSLKSNALRLHRPDE